MPDYHSSKESLFASSGYDTEFYSSFGSSHSTGSNFAMCDGSVRSIAYTISPIVFAYLSTRNVKLSNPQANLKLVPPVAPDNF